MSYWEDAKPGRVGPSQISWSDALKPMVAQQKRYAAMAERWYAEHGKGARPDPGQEFVNLATAGARGDDITEAAARAGIGR